MNFFEKKLKFLSKSIVLGFLGLFVASNSFAAIGSLAGAREREKKIQVADKKRIKPGADNSRAARRASLAKERTLQEKRDDIDWQPLSDVLSSKSSDRFTQTEAHLHLNKIRKLIDRDYNVAPYLNVISTVLANETKYKNDYYAFYHTTSNVWRLTQDLYTQLYAHDHPGEVDKEFKFLRFNNESVNATAQGFLVNELKEKGLVDDNTETGAILLSANLALFGNVGFSGECSWRYFVDPQNHKKPEKKTYETMMKNFGLTDKYIDEIMSLVDIYDTKEDTIVQILVPQNKIDEIGYLAWVKGIPAHQETIDLITATARGKQFPKVKPVMEALAERFAKEKSNNKIYKDMLESVNAGDFSLASYLKVYRNKPWELDNINDVTVRLLFTPDVLLNPSSGVKFYRFSATHRDKMKEYRTRLNAIVDKLIAEKEAREDAAKK